MSEQEQTKIQTIYTRASHNKAPSTSRPVLVGCRISPDWLQGGAALIEGRMTGPLLGGISDLMVAAKDGGPATKNLPIAALRLALTASMRNIVSLHRDLGVGVSVPALQMFAPANDNRDALREQIANKLKSWAVDVLEPWAERHGMGEIAARVRRACDPQYIELVDNVAHYRNNGAPAYGLIARSIGEKLVGDELFPGLGPCEMVATPDDRGNTLELMTSPKLLPKGDRSFSMVARLTVCTIPFSDDIYVGVSCMKRVWASRMPGISINMPRRVSGYILAPGRPAVQIPIERADGQWGFEENAYVMMQRESGATLPLSLEDAIRQREVSQEVGWWVGLPELTQIFKFVAPRTVFEADEMDLLKVLRPKLGFILNESEIPLREVSLVRFQAKLKQEMLKVSDLEQDWIAGSSLVIDDDEDIDIDEEEGEEESAAQRQAKLARYRTQNIAALRACGSAAPRTLWLMGGNAEEQSIVKMAVKRLFDDEIKVIAEPLPIGTHDIKANLDGNDLPAKKRFDLRVEKWEQATSVIKEVAKGEPVLALVCAPDHYGNYQEDQVNYYAGIHALCKAGANVHYLLPMEPSKNDGGQQSFLHRTQSALLDVILAHSGVVVGVKPLLERLFTDRPLPNAIYGIQAMRSRARSFSGESNVSFILYTRLLVETGITEIQIVHCQTGKTKRTAWMPLSDGLRWVGCERSLVDGNEPWLKQVFVDETRDTLVIIAEQDPNAVVMIDWQTVTGLWKGIRDEDLNKATPKLGDIPLSRFAPLSFIRLRRGNDTMALREDKRVTYEGWLEQDGRRQQTGEIRVDEYYTTGKTLVEVTSKGDVGHFVCSMGYAKQVQVKRGLSCYRSMVRLRRSQNGYVEFPLEQGNIDAALPAPMDITVLQVRDGIQAEHLATLVMGLRLGYAHYNDWTTLPAPLFFQRKINDYIIRYPDDTGAETVVPETVPEIPEVVTPTTQLELRLADLEELPTQAQAEDPSVSRSSVMPVGVNVSQDDATLIKRASSIEPIQIYKHSEKLYKAMMLNQAGGVQVHVPLPYFVNLNTLFNNPINKTMVHRYSAKVWNRLRDFGYVPTHGQRKPSDGNFLSVIAQKMVVPQAFWGLFAVCRGLINLTFWPMDELILREYNPHVSDEDKIFDLKVIPENIIHVAGWARENNHDELLAWLIFCLAQSPSIIHENLSEFWEEVHFIPGDMTRDAIDYYIQSAAAIEAALDQKDLKNFKRVIAQRIDPPLESKATPIQNLPEPRAVEPEKRISVGSSPVPIDGIVKPLDETVLLPPADAPLPKAIPSAPKTSNQEGSTFMELKNQLLQLLSGLELGSEEFDQQIKHIQILLNRAEGMHLKEVERLAALKAADQALKGLMERGLAVAEEFNAIHADIQLQLVTYKEPMKEAVETARDQISRLEVKLVEIKDQLAIFASLKSPGPDAGLVERRRYNDISSNALGTIDRVAAELKGLIEESVCFHFEGESDGPAGEEPQQKSENVPAPTEIQELAQAVPDSIKAVLEIPSALEANFGESTPASESDQKTVAEAVAEVIARAEATIVQQPALVETVIADLIAEEVSNEAPAPVEMAPSHVSLSIEQILEDEEEVEEGGGDISHHIDILSKLMKRRYYGLAEVQAEALSMVIEKEHGLILKSLIKALDAMVCQCEFSTQMDKDLSDHLLSESLRNSSLCAQEFAALGVLGAGFSSLLFDSYGDLWNVINAISIRLTGQEALVGLMHHMDKIHQHRMVLTRDKFLSSKIGEKESILFEISRMRDAAKIWKDSAEIYSNWNHRGFARMHEELFSSRTPIGLCLQYIANGEHEKLKRTFPEAERMLQKPTATVEEIWKRNRERTRMEGLYAQLAIKNVEKTERFVTRYLELLAASESPSSRGGQLPRNEQSTLDELHDHLRRSLEEINDMAPSTTLERLYQEAAIETIEAGLRLYERQSTQVCVPQVKQKLLIQLPMDMSLMPCLAPVDEMTPALCTPDDVFEVTSYWADVTFTMDDSHDGIDKHLREALDTHIEHKRFLPAFRIINEVGTKSQQDELMMDYARAKTGLITDLQEASQRVAHALTLSSSLGQEQANQMQRVIDTMMASLRQENSIGSPKGDLMMYPDFPYAITALSYNALLPLDNILKEAGDRLEAELNLFNEQPEMNAEVRRVKEILKGNNPASLRTAYDAMSMLKEYRKLPDHIGAPADMATTYENFVREYHQAVNSDRAPLDSLKHRLEEPSREGDPNWLRALGTEERQEALDLIEAWIDLHSNKEVRHDCTVLNKVLGMIGISDPGADNSPETGRNNRAQFMLENKRVFYFPSGLGDDVFIPPKLGSEARHIRGFVMHGKPSENDLIQVVNEIGSTPTMILTRSHFTMAKRGVICGQFPVILIDDDLLAYIAVHPMERLQAMMRVAVLTFANNPYADYGVRPVPPEMFFGRQKELASLREVKSMAILYGGRRLGKSSLFNQIVEETKAPEMAIMMSLINCDITDHVNSAWRAIYTQLLHHKVIDELPERKQIDGKSIKSWVESEIIRNEKQLRSLYLLLDEADDLMARDLDCENDKRLIKELSNLIENVQSHGFKLRIAIAGLHNMGRMSNEKNSVYGKIEPIALEPFTTPEDMQRGLRLITKPMAAMGFLFEEDRQDLPMRIMSVCNYYPAFIQLYCKELVEHMQNKRQKGRLPVHITPDDLDAVERNHTLLSELRSKFELNLDLDKRYKAIALVLAEIYYSSVESGKPYEGLEVKDIRSYCETLAPNHFRDVGSGTYEALLDEMCKLKILKRHGTCYMLRNPDISRMMGDRGQVSNKIDDLATEKPNSERTYGDRYITMESSGKHKYFPLPVGWIRSNLQRGGESYLMILTGNNLSGLLDLNAETKDVWMIGQEWVHKEMVGQSPRHLNEFLQEERGKRPRSPYVQLLTVRPNAWKVSDIQEYATIAEKAMALDIRIALIAPPERSLELATAWTKGALPGFDYGTLHKWAPVIVPPWSEDALYFLMNENQQVARNPEALRNILKATCGFGNEVRAFCDKSLTLEAALSAPAKVWPKLGGTLDNFYKRVGVPPSLTQERRDNIHNLLPMIQGEQRGSERVEEYRENCKVLPGDLFMLNLIGLLQEGPSNTWHVPDLYLDLIQKEVERT